MMHRNDIVRYQILLVHDTLDSNVLSWEGGELYRYYQSINDVQGNETCENVLSIFLN